MSREITGDNTPELTGGLRGGLVKYTLEGKWEELINMYNDHSAAHTTKFTDAWNTALHVVIDLDEEAVVMKLVDAIIRHEKNVGDLASEEKEINKALEMKNIHEDTPLHIAASRGFAKICKYIIGSNAERMHLVRLRNKKGETPLFVAALNWNKGAFAYLFEVSRRHFTSNLEELVRNNGDSILHCAIEREHFDLAVIIMHHNDSLKLGGHTNKEGFTPLKVLANRPSAFKSTTRLSWWKLILYHCIFVEPLDVKSTMEKILTNQRRSEEMKFPKNYATLCDFFHIVPDLFGKLLFCRKDNHDEENASKSLEKYQVRFWQPKYATIGHFVKFVHVLSLGLLAVEGVENTKKKHEWSGQLLEALMEKPSKAITEKGVGPSGPRDSDVETNREHPTPPVTTQNDSKMRPISRRCDCGRVDCNSYIEAAIPVEGHLKSNAKETAFLAAARNGIVEMVTTIHRLIPNAIHDTNSMEQNVLLVAVKNRQPQVVRKLRKKLKGKEGIWNNLIIGVDNENNTMLHLAAMASEKQKRWDIAGSAMQMMWDIKWYQYIKRIVPEHCYFRDNKCSKTAGQIFKTSHEKLIQQGSDWLKQTSESCSVVAALVAGVSFATASTVPGGTNDQGKPPLEGQPAFDAFAIASLIGLCFSVTGLIMFLSILTSRKEAGDFRRGLPLKLLGGLSSLFVSIIAMFVSFCSGHFFIINHKYTKLLLPFYAVTSIPVVFYALAQFPLYLDLLAAIIAEVPWASDTGDTL